MKVQEAINKARISSHHPVSDLGLRQRPCQWRVLAACSAHLLVFTKLTGDVAHLSALSLQKSQGGLCSFPLQVQPHASQEL